MVTFSWFGGGGLSEGERGSGEVSSRSPMRLTISSSVVAAAVELITLDVQVGTEAIGSQQDETEGIPPQGEPEKPCISGEGHIWVGDPTGEPVGSTKRKKERSTRYNKTNYLQANYKLFYKLSALVQGMDLPTTPPYPLSGDSSLRMVKEVELIEVVGRQVSKGQLMEQLEAVTAGEYV